MLAMAERVKGENGQTRDEDRDGGKAIVLSYLLINEASVRMKKRMKVRMEASVRAS